MTSTASAKAAPESAVRARATSAHARGGGPRPLGSEVLGMATMESTDMRDPCPHCSADRALVGRAHRCVPVPAATAFASGRTLNVVTVKPERIDVDKLPSRGSAKFFRVKVDGQVIIQKTKSQGAIFSLLALHGWTGEVVLYRNGRKAGVRAIDAEARKVFAAHDIGA